jgi:hypothetical protein
MSKRERRRLELLSRVRDGKLTLMKASELLELRASKGSGLFVSRLGCGLVRV